MCETHHSDQPSQEPPLSPRERAQRRQIELYGEQDYVEPTKSPEELAAEMRVTKMIEERTKRISAQARLQMQIKFNEFHYGRCLQSDARSEVELTLERYRADVIEKPSVREKRTVQVAILQRLLAGEALGEWSFAALLESIRDQLAATTSKDEELEDIFNYSLDVFAERGWIGIANPLKDAEEEGESLA